MKKGGFLMELYYFTDASITYYQNSKPRMGAYGYLCLDKFFDLKESSIELSIYPDTNYLESTAIFDCLLHIQTIARLGVKYYLFTDSSSTFDLLEQSMVYNKRIKKNQLFHQQVKNIIPLIYSMVEQGIDIHIIDTKGHCHNIQALSKYLDKKTPGFDINQKNLILYGNHLIDCMVHNSTKYRKQYSFLHNNTLMPVMTKAAVYS